MASIPIKCPPLGVSVFTGVVAEWYVKTGDAVTEGQPIWSVETDKVTQDAYASTSGTMGEIVAQAGEVVEPEQVVGYIETEVGATPGGDEPKPSAAKASTAKAEPAPAKAEPEPANAATAPAKAEASTAPAKTEKVADVSPKTTAASDASGVAAQAAQAATSTARDEETALAMGQKSPADTAAAPEAVEPKGGGSDGGGAKAQPASTGNGRATAAASTSTTTVERGQPNRLSPRARRLMRENNLSESDLGAIAGSGRSGRVQSKDIERFLASGRKAEVERRPQAAQSKPSGGGDSPTPYGGKPAPSATPKKAPVSLPPVAVTGEEQVEVQKLTTIRKTIATYLRNSVDIAVHCTSIDEADVTTLVSLRGRIKETIEERYGIKLTYTSFIAHAVAASLREFPMINSVMDMERGEVRINHHVHLGIAVDAPAGLMVPVLRFAEQKTLLQLQAEIDGIAQRARDGKITLEELQGSTFTITNAGASGSIASTPIINYPNVGILGVHSIRKMPVVRDGQIVVRDIVTLATTFDHRLIDGVYAVRFMRSVIERLENPELALMG